MTQRTMTMVLLVAGLLAAGCGGGAGTEREQTAATAGEVAPGVKTPAAGTAPETPAPSEEPAPSPPPAQPKAPAVPAPTSPEPAATPAPAPATEPAPSAPSPKPAPAPEQDKVVDPGGAIAVTSSNAAATLVGTKKCRMCHKVQFNSWSETAHAKRTPPLDCESCHGPGSDYDTMSVMKDAEKAKAAGLVFPDASFCKKCHKAGWSDDMLPKAHAHKTSG